MKNLQFNYLTTILACTYMRISIRLQKSRHKNSFKEGE